MWAIFWASVAVAQAAVISLYLLLRKRPRIEPFRMIDSWQEDE